MDRNQIIITKLTKQTVGGQSVLRRFFQKILKEDQKDLRHMELTYFALSVTTVFYLQFGRHDNKQKLLREVSRTVFNKGISTNGEEINIEQLQKKYEDRLSEYSNLIVNLLNENNRENPIVTLIIRFYENVTRKSAANQSFDTRKAGKILTKYIIDNINYVKKEFAEET